MCTSFVRVGLFVMLTCIFKLLFTGEKLNVVQRECIYVVELNFRSLNVKNNVSCCIVEIR